MTHVNAKIAALVLVGGLLWAPAHAGDQLQTTILPSLSPNPRYALSKRGKFKVKPSNKLGEGGILLQLTLSGIDCPSPGPGNDGDVARKCGAVGSPVLDHVMVLTIHALGLKFIDIVGVKYQIVKGKALFQATGTNKVTGGLFGGLVSTIYNSPIGMGIADYREAGTVASDCDAVPLPIKTCKGGTNAGAGCTTNANCNSNVCSANGCTNGQAYAQNGILAGSDSGIGCVTTLDCSDTQLCISGACAQEPCTVDADCNQDGAGNGGTGECGTNGQCCDPNVDPTCTDQVP